MWFWQQDGFLRSQSPEGSSYLCDCQMIREIICAIVFCLNHPKALLLSATGSQQRQAQSYQVSITRRLFLSLQLYNARETRGSMGLKAGGLNHPEALLVSAIAELAQAVEERDVSVARGLFLSLQLPASAVGAWHRRSQSPEGSSYLCNFPSTWHRGLSTSTACLNHPKALLPSATSTWTDVASRADWSQSSDGSSYLRSKDQINA